ncbi:YgaP family membrane protein [Porticoccus sp.]|uniref:YgaP family membrane protein n=1 Tax=Porticoccus sp. TaxID=2024853 RepID=UPI003F69B4DF
MKINLGTADRLLRLVVGLVLITLVFIGPQTAWGWIGLIPLATALLGNCPVYSLLGFDTCRTKKQAD